MNLSAVFSTRTAKIAGGAGAVAAGLAAGTATGSLLTKGAYRHDRLADPNQIVERRDGLVVERKRPDLGPLAMLGSVGAGTIAAGGSAAWGLSATAQAKSSAGLLHRFGASALFAMGIGVIAGGVGSSMQYQDTTFRPE